MAGVIDPAAALLHHKALTFTENMTSCRRRAGSVRAETVIIEHCVLGPDSIHIEVGT